ncbi:putative ABC exporter domain-containing protein [Algoriphagus terrigena]|uniref:putative ABC exporter domain-containing protein n=1 Tax=Algoriphagus terrigena TaxID=344884 RepID=UPI0003FBD63F|nr:putative ABC exporter domain-containing protein [Algoriphagus terrigena]
MLEIRLLLKKDFWILINNLKLILRNPLRLIPYGILVGYFTFVYSQGTKKRESGDFDQLQDLGADGLPETNFAMQNVVGGITILALGFLVFQLYRATKSNVSFFKMADVNLLFTAPVKPENLLLYYMARSIIPSLGGAILFVIYGASQLTSQFELTLGKGIFIILGFALFMFMVFPIRFLIYTLHTKYGVMDYIRGGVIGLGVALGLIILIPGFLADKFWQGMFSWVASPWFDLFPLVGWSRGIISYATHENLLLAFGYLGLYGLSYYTVVKLVIRFAGYYYEDVLEATKTNEDKLEKVRGKQGVDEGSYSLNTKKQLALPDFGAGAKALYWRNYIHSSRQDFHPIIGIYTISMAVIGIVLAGLSNFDWFSHKVLYFYLLFMLFFYFMAGIGRANIGDLKKPFFILIPATWTSKFWNMIKLDIVQTVLFAVILIVPSVFLAHVSIWLIPLFVVGIVVCYLIGFAINIIPQVGLDEGWDRKLIKPFMIGGIIFFGVIPPVILSIIVFLITRQFVWTLLTGVVGLSFVAAILLHVTLDVLKRIEFKEV